MANLYEMRSLVDPRKYTIAEESYDGSRIDIIITRKQVYTSYVDAPNTVIEPATSYSMSFRREELRVIESTYIVDKLLNGLRSYDNAPRPRMSVGTASELRAEDILPEEDPIPLELSYSMKSKQSKSDHINAYINGGFATQDVRRATHVPTVMTGADYGLAPNVFIVDDAMPMRDFSRHLTAEWQPNTINRAPRPLPMRGIVGDSPLVGNEEELF